MFTTAGPLISTVARSFSSLSHIIISALLCLLRFSLRHSKWTSSYDDFCHTVGFHFFDLGVILSTYFNSEWPSYKTISEINRDNILEQLPMMWLVFSGLSPQGLHRSLHFTAFIEAPSLLCIRYLVGIPCLWNCKRKSFKVGSNNPVTVHNRLFWWST